MVAAQIDPVRPFRLMTYQTQTRLSFMLKEPGEKLSHSGAGWPEAAINSASIKAEVENTRDQLSSTNLFFFISALFFTTMNVDFFYEQAVTFKAKGSNCLLLKMKNRKKRNCKQTSIKHPAGSFSLQS